MLATVGRVLITAGVVVLLFVAYELWGTNIQESRAQRSLRGELDERLATAASIGDFDQAEGDIDQPEGDIDQAEGDPGEPSSEPLPKPDSLLLVSSVKMVGAIARADIEMGQPLYLLSRRI